MPLKTLRNRSYLDRHMIHVSSEDAVPSESPGVFDFTVKLQNEIQNVVSIELVGWSLPSFLAPTFPGRYNTLFSDRTRGDVASNVPAATSFNWRIYDATQTASVDLNVNVENPDSLSTLPFSYANEALTSLVSALRNSATGALDKQGITEVNSFNTTLVVEVDANTGLLKMYAMEAATQTPLPSTISFLPNASNASDYAARAMGFQQGQSYVGVLQANASPSSSGFDYIVQSPRAITLSPFRYVDVFVQQAAADFSPLDRVYINSASTTPIYIQPSADRTVRLLTNPVRRLDKLNIALKLENGKRIATGLASGLQLTFQVLALSQKNEVPKWVQQEFKIE